MMYLFAIFIPPLYFLFRKKWVGFIINSFFYGIACLLLLLFFPMAPFFWLPAMIHAMWNVRKELVVEHAEIFATKMAEKMSVTARPITK